MGLKRSKTWWRNTWMVPYVTILSRLVLLEVQNFWIRPHINNYSTLSFTFWTVSKTLFHIQNKLVMSKLFLNLKKDKSLSRKADSISEPWNSKGKLSTSHWISKLDFLYQDTLHHFWKTAELGRLGRTRCIRFLPKFTKAEKLLKSYCLNTHSLPRYIHLSFVWNVNSKHN